MHKEIGVFMNKSKSFLNILLSLLIVGFGVQMFTSCFWDDDDEIENDTGGASSSSKLSSSSTGTGKSSSSVIDNSVYGDPVTYDGKTYQTVIIGEQTWFKQNLGGTKLWATAMDLPSECNNKPSSSPCKITLPHRGICPEGFHIPSSVEWGKLYQYVMANMIGDYADPCEYLGSRCQYPGSQNKEFPDTYGFSADRDTDWWAADLAQWGMLGSLFGSVPFTSIFREFNDLSKRNNSIRCLKDGADASYKIPEKKQLTDTRDNQTYKTIMIGRQNWMAENLKYNATGSKCGDDDKKLKDTTTSTCDNYGRLYNWATAMDLPSKCNEALSISDADCSKNAVHQGVCPSGWHLPSRDEWKELEKYAYFGDGSLRAANGWGIQFGGKNNEITQDLNGTDDYGFSALPGGAGHVIYEDGFSSWWSASDTTNQEALGYRVDPSKKSGDTNLSRDSRSTDIGEKFAYVGVRCVKD